MYNNFGNRGYIGRSMSVRASECYDDNIKPKSRWKKSEIIEMISEINDDLDLKLLKKVKLDTMKTCFLRYDSWHHTGKFYKRTEFYSLDYVLIQELTNETVKNYID